MSLDLWCQLSSFLCNLLLQFCCGFLAPWGFPYLHGRHCEVCISLSLVGWLELEVNTTLWKQHEQPKAERWEEKVGGRKEEGDVYLFFPLLSGLRSRQSCTRGNSHRDMYQLHPRWMARAHDGLPWQGRWHALLCRHIFSQGVFARYFIAWSSLVGVSEKRLACVYRIQITFFFFYLKSVVFLWLLVWFA